MKVGIFSPYLDTMGGGERYIFTVAEFFLKRKNAEVNIFWNQALDQEKIKERFGIDLTGATASPYRGFSATAGYDLMFFLSDGSIPASFAGKNILHFQMPFKLDGRRDLINKFKLSRFNHIICNSNFTKKYIDQTFGIESEVLYPPVDVENFDPGKKENLILSVGRFFSPSHPKKQEILIRAFQEFGLPGWKLVLIGGVTLNSNDEVARLRELVGKSAVEIIPDGSLATLRDHYSRAKIYWHAAGFGEDLEKFPDKAEHFGMTTVEAMAAGCVPVVFGGGGQKEIITDARNGFLWSTTDELKAKTAEIAGDEALRKYLSANASKRSKDFSKQKFFEQLSTLI
jgi:glycosyltransferase involved in cell wall biosynthesis